MLSGNICCVTVIQLGIFFFNLGMQINGMGKKSEQVPCRSQGSALNTCGCFTDRWEVWMRKVSKTTGLQVCAFF